MRLAIKQAVEALRRGEVLGYPTEAVWGLGCEPMNRHAVEQVLTLKRRDWRKGLILIAADFAQLEPYVGTVSTDELQKAFATWPGPHTWLFPASASAPHLITGGRDSIAVRVSAHPGVVELCRAYGGAIVSTSANVSRRAPARSAVQLRRLFGNEIQILGGSLGGRATPTPIRDLRTGRTLRL